MLTLNLHESLVFYATATKELQTWPQRRNPKSTSHTCKGGPHGSTPRPEFSGAALVVRGKVRMCHFRACLTTGSPSPSPSLSPLSRQRKTRSSTFLPVTLNELTGDSSSLDVERRTRTLLHVEGCRGLRFSPLFSILFPR